MKAIIMAAGKSTRTYPLTVTRPKPLLKVANRTIVEHQIEALKGIVDGVILVVGYKADMIRAALGAACFGMPIEYVEQTEQLGTGHAILQCAPLIREPFLALNGDDLYALEDLRALAQTPRRALAKEADDPSQAGIYEVDSSGRVIRLVEKPKEIFSKLANIGAYHFDPEIFDVLKETTPSERGEIEITSAIQALAAKKEFHVIEAKGHWIPIAYPWHLLTANEFLLSTQLTSAPARDFPGAFIEGPVLIEEGARILPGAYIQGPAIIGRGAWIGPNCYIRPATSIGAGCKVGQGVEIKNSILMDGAAVPHLSYVGDSVIGEKANLGCGTITANFRHDARAIRSKVKNKIINTGRTKFGAIIGDGVHTGINTSIYPGRKLWPGVTTLPGQTVTADIES